MDVTNIDSWGLQAHQARLINNMPYFHHGAPIAIDVETDEKDNFVGMAFCLNDKEVFYTDKLTPELKQELSDCFFIGHNLKADLHFLRRNGVEVSSDQLYFDTMLASYVTNPTKDSHGLKQLAKEIMGWEWPAYKEIVGKGKKKLTLDKQPYELVSNYCGMDVLATHRLWRHFHAFMTPNQRRILEHLELPIARLLYEMECTGVQVEVEYLKVLEQRFSKQLQDIEEQLMRYVA